MVQPQEPGRAGSMMRGASLETRAVESVSSESVAGDSISESGPGSDNQECVNQWLRGLKAQGLQERCRKPSVVHNVIV